MATRLTPYLNFREGTLAAMEFYRSVFGGELSVSTFGETPGMGLEESEKDKVLHSMLEVGSDMTLMAADVPSGMDVSPNGTLTLSGDDEERLRGWWDALSAGGTVGVPLEKAPWGDSFGACTDRFGVGWMVNISGRAEQ
jgi:PhnB protein